MHGQLFIVSCQAWNEMSSHFATFLVARASIFYRAARFLFVQVAAPTIKKTHLEIIAVELQIIKNLNANKNS
jgi:hypothetical protein